MVENLSNDFLFQTPAKSTTILKIPNAPKKPNSSSSNQNYQGLAVHIHPKKTYSCAEYMNLFFAKFQTEIDIPSSNKKT